ncbi:putative cob(I)alamin adenosyltransferase [Candidatus Hodgkinia cicadicola]|nr:putative cob(I)alamin adenosyltransferase [Candidatus Hodgkinia cicadicola]
MPRDLRFHNYIRKGLCVCLYGGGRFKTSAVLGFVARSGFRGLACVSVSVLKLVWNSKTSLGYCVCRFRQTGDGSQQLNKGCEWIALVSYWCVISKLIGDPFWLCVCLDEPVLAYRRKLGVRMLFALRPSQQTVFVAARKRISSHCAVQYLCKRNHFNGGIGAQVGIEY